MNSLEEEKSEELPKIIGKIESNSTKVILTNSDARTFYDQSYFGTFNKQEELELHPEEALLLFERKRVEISSNELENGQEHFLTANELVKLFSENDIWFWVNYQVYKDLRNRGYVVRPGYGEFAPYRLYPRGARPEEAVSKILVYPLGEGNHLDLERLDQIVSGARLSRKDLVLAVVDRLGDVTYYRAEAMKLERNPYNYEFKNEGEPIPLNISEIS